MTMISVLEVLQKTATFLESKGVENGRLNAELLVGHALGLKRMQLYLQFERILPEADLERIRPLVRRRATREPLQYILGTVPFGDLELKVDRRALIPRPETEYLIELVKAAWGEPAPARFADLGTGSGALALALAAAWPGAQGVAIDASAEALSLAGENAQALGLADRVRFLQSDWLASLGADERFEVIVANPPYLTSAEVAESAPEVRVHEPAMALSTAADGMDALRLIVRETPRFLQPGGLLAMETGIAQHPELQRLLAAAGFESIESKPDLAGRHRFLLARRGSS